MKSLIMIKFFFLLAMLMALLAITLSAMAPESHDKTSLKGASHLFASRAVTTCDKNPKVCGAAAAVGASPECCNKKCVDLKTDKLNCGKCGVKSKQTEICCNGHIVNPMSDKNHCGSCDNHCKNGAACALGMCSYA